MPFWIRYLKRIVINLLTEFKYKIKKKKKKQECNSHLGRLEEGINRIKYKRDGTKSKQWQNELVLFFMEAFLTARKQNKKTLSGEEIKTTRFRGKKQNKTKYYYKEEPVQRAGYSHRERPLSACFLAFWDAALQLSYNFLFHRRRQGRKSPEQQSQWHLLPSWHCTTPITPACNLCPQKIYKTFFLTLIFHLLYVTLNVFYFLLDL